MKTKVLMVCLGNICRSPLAEGILRWLTNTDDFYIDSAGTANYHLGRSPENRSISIAADNGIDISNQKARQLTKHDLEKFNYILVMDKKNLCTTKSLCNSFQQEKKISMITKTNGNEFVCIPDPYYGSADEFSEVFKLLTYYFKNWLSKYKLYENK